MKVLSFSGGRTSDYMLAHYDFDLAIFCNTGKEADGITKKHILEYWKNQPLDLDIHSHEGNCDLCFLKGIGKKVKLLQDKPEIADWWIEMGNIIGGTFNKDNSVKNILERSKSQQTFDFDDSIDCFCNID